MESNQANGGLAALGTGPQASGEGGGVFKAAGGTITADSFTRAHIINNTDSKNDAFKSVTVRFRGSWMADRGLKIENRQIGC